MNAGHKHGMALRHHCRHRTSQSSSKPVCVAMDDSTVRDTGMQLRSSSNAPGTLMDSGGKPLGLQEIGDERLDAGPNLIVPPLEPQADFMDSETVVTFAQSSSGAGGSTEVSYTPINISVSDGVLEDVRVTHSLPSEMANPSQGPGSVDVMTRRPRRRSGIKRPGRSNPRPSEYVRFSAAVVPQGRSCGDTNHCDNPLAGVTRSHRRRTFNWEGYSFGDDEDGAARVEAYRPLQEMRTDKAVVCFSDIFSENNIGFMPAG